MNVTITYSLSQTGRKASLLAGGDGAQKQTITVTPDMPEFARAVEAASFSYDGKPIVDVYCYDDFDVIPTVDQILDVRESCAAKKAAKEAAEKESIRAATQAVLDGRKTSKDCSYTNDGDVSARYEYDVAAWPYDAPLAIRESPEAVAWIAELAAERESAAVAAIEKKKIELAAESMKAAKAAEKETARRAALGMADGEIDLSIEDGALIEVPRNMWESHKRGKNWMATITVNPASPGGLDRDFVSKAKGDSYYLLPTLSPGDAIEFGADYYSGGGRKNSNRWYGYVVRIIPETADEYSSLILRQIAGGKTAVKEGQKFAAKLATVIA